MKRNHLTISVAVAIIALMLTASVTNADVPPRINYQGHVSDSSGQPLDTSISITFAIYVAPTGGTPLWSEMHPVQINNGAYSVILGTFVSLPDDLFNGSDRYLGVTIGGDTEIDPRTQLVSVPYGLISKRVSGDIETANGALTVLNPVTSDTAVSIDSSGINLHGSALESEGTVKSATGKIKIQGGKLTSQSGAGFIEIRETGMEFKYESSTGPRLNLDIGTVVTFEPETGKGISITTSGVKLVGTNITAIDPASPSDTTVKLTGGASPSLIIGNAVSGQTNTSTPLLSWLKDNVSGKDIRIDNSIQEIKFKDGSDSARIRFSESVGAFRAFTIEPSNMDFPDLKIKISNEAAEEWFRWYGDHLVVGPSGEVICSSDVKLRSLFEADVNADGMNDFVVSGFSPTVAVAGGTTFDCVGPAVFTAPVQVGAGAPPPPMSALHVNGTFTATGAKLFVQDHPTDPEKEIVYVALEGGEAGTYTRGSAKLENGIAEIELPEDFALVTNANGITAQVTPTEAVQGMLYVAEKSSTKIVVRAAHQKDNKVSFDYVVNGIRRGFENHQPIREKIKLASK